MQKAKNIFILADEVTIRLADDVIWAEDIMISADGKIMCWWHHDITECCHIS